METELPVAVDDGVTCIVTSLIADDHVGILCQIIDYTPLSLVPPLETYYTIYSHFLLPLILFTWNHLCDIWKSTVLLLIVQPVSDNPDVGDVEAFILN